MKTKLNDQNIDCQLRRQILTQISFDNVDCWIKVKFNFNIY